MLRALRITRNWRSFPWVKLMYLTVGMVFTGWLLNTPHGLMGKADAVGYAVCHRIDLHSFHLGGRQLPLCVRCTGMFLGAVLGLVYQGIAAGRRAGMPPRRVGAVLVVLAGAFIVDGVNSYLRWIPSLPGLYPPAHWLRLVTGTGLGVALAALLFPVYNQSVWQAVDPRPALSGLPSLARLLALAAVLDLLVFTENPLLLYPLALLSAAGVLVVLVMIYLLLLLMLRRAENRYRSMSELAPAWAAGFGIAIFQVALLDLARFRWTGTWAGFTLG